MCYPELLRPDDLRGDGSDDYACSQGGGRDDEHEAWGLAGKGLAGVQDPPPEP